MSGSTYSAYTSDKSPGVARIAALEYRFNATNHSPCAVGIGNYSVLNFYLNPEMTFYTGYRIYNYSLCHDYFSLGVSIPEVVSGAFAISRCLRIFVRIA